MPKPSPDPLSRREREVLDILFRLKRATANDVLAAMADPPSNSSVRSILRLLRDKGLVQHAVEGTAHVFTPTARRDQAQKSALRHLLATLFDDSPAQVVSALLDVSKARLRSDEVDRIQELIERARKEGR